MGPLMLASFIDELTKISEVSSAASTISGNAASPAKSGLGGNAMVSSMSKGSKTGISVSKPSVNPMAKSQVAKPTNYSIVHSSSPSAAFGPPSSKMVPPPAVRT